MGGNNSTSTYDKSANCPLTFHTCHGKNIQLSNGKRRARRTRSFCDGIVFSNRPISINELVHLKQEYSTTIQWSGGIKVGCTSFNPSQTTSSSLPQYASTHLTRRPGHWVQSIPQHLQQENVILSFFVNNDGELCLYSNGEGVGVLITGISTLEPLWMIVDVYGNTRGVQFIDILNEPFNIDIASSQSSLPILEVGHEYQPDEPFNIDIATSQSSLPILEVGHEYQPVADTDEDEDEDADPDRNLAYGSDDDLLNLDDVDEPDILVLERPNELDFLTFETLRSSPEPREEDPDDSLTLYPSARLSSRSFSTSCGRGISIEDGRFARRQDSLFSQIPIVFSDGPLAIGRTMLFQIISSSTQSNLCVGVTSCNPESLDVNFLPSCSYELVDRDEYWVLGRIRDVVGSGDYVSITVQSSGWVKYKVNNREEQDLFFCDVTQELWVFIDLDEFVEAIRFVGELSESSTPRDQIPSTSRQFPFLWDLPPASTSEDSASGPSTPVLDSPLETVANIVATFNRVFLDSNDDNPPREVVIAQSSFDETEQSPEEVSVLPPVSNVLDLFSNDRRSDSLRDDEFVSGNDVVGSEDRSSSSSHQSPPAVAADPEEPANRAASRQSNASQSEKPECSICCCEEANTAIYDCGHICMCVECAENLRGRSRVPVCPICRRPIKDVIKVFHA